jgi:hypothetical protein
MKKKNEKTQPNNVSGNKMPNAELNQERAELFQKINIKMFEDLAKKRGVTLEQLLSAGIKAYLQDEEKKK